MSGACHFHLEILAPRGLAGIEPYLSSFRLGLKPYRSAFNGQVILRMSRDDGRFEFEMDSSTTDTLRASGDLDFPESEAWEHIESLSKLLKLAGFPHRIGMDTADGELYRRISYEMPSET
jgi:hypothetical protein